jgi:hypothetical protein
MANLFETDEKRLGWLINAELRFFVDVVEQKVD